MQIVCEATQSSAANVQVGAFECLVKIMTLYYDKMAFYMESAIFGVWSKILRAIGVSNVPQLTLLAMQHIDESVSKQGVEFWSTVCEEEIELAIEAAEVSETHYLTNARFTDWMASSRHLTIMRYRNERVAILPRQRCQNWSLPFSVYC